VREDTIVRVRSARTRVEGEGQPRERKAKPRSKAKHPAVSSEAIARVDPVVQRARHRRAANDETRDVPEETFETMRSRGDAACGVLSRVRRQGLARGFSRRVRSSGLVLHKNVIMHD
jgi:hypothetical protein